MSLIAKLDEMRNYGGTSRTTGLDDATIERFAAIDPDLNRAIDDALARHHQLREEFHEFLKLDENDQVLRAQAGFINFYPEDAVNPYVPAAAKGPWIVTLKGAVLHDNGGYGMLGFGHNNDAVDAALAGPQVMANVMTPSIAQMRFTAALNREIGHRRKAGNPFVGYMCLNSGSEAVGLAGRFADVNSKEMTSESGKHAGRKIKRIAVRGAFHGRTSLPALYSDSTRAVYLKYLASFARHDHELVIVEPYNVGQLKDAFGEADKQGWHIEAMFLEPVMGEGDPGRAVTPEFYAAARELTKAHGTLLLIDSIQAGLRTHGVLSVIDYPGFENLEAPDMETYSKALNAGQYPLSVLALTERAAKLYRKGVYGNTMTANPRALDVACAVLAQLDEGVRENIRQRGAEFIERLNKLMEELGGLITRIQGTGLLLSCELDPSFKCYGAGSTEEYMRERGIGVVHGGANSLRFTPHFNVTSAEIGLIIEHVRHALKHGPRKQTAEAA